MWMAKRKKTLEEQVQECISDLKQAYAQWQRQYVEGVGDPNWPDGTNLNLVHNHICFYKRRLRELQEQGWMGEFPEVFFQPEPPKLDNDYMARKDEILQQALQTKEEIIRSEMYCQLCSLAKTQKERPAVLQAFDCFVHSLEQPLGKHTAKDYVGWRRQGRLKHWTDWMRSTIANGKTK